MVGRRLSGYALANLGLGYGIATGAVLALFFVFDLISASGSAGVGDFTVADAALVVLLTMPSRFVELSPVISLLGITYALGVLGHNRELVAARAVGVSSLGITLLVGISLLLLYLVVAGVELSGRSLYQKAVLYRALEITNRSDYLGDGGLWIADPGGMIRVGHYGASNTVSDIEIYDFAANRTLQRQIIARRLSIGADGTWRLHDGLVKRFQPEHVETEPFEELVWQPQAHKSNVFFDFPVESLSLADLREQIHERRLADESANTLELEFWKRCLLPGAGLAFGLLAAAFGLRERTRGGLGMQLALGVLAALVLFLVHQVAVNALLAAGALPAVAVTLPVLTIGLIGGLLLLRAT